MTTTENMIEITDIISDQKISIFSMIHDADIMSKSVMMILLIASVWSWTIIFSKLFSIRAVKVKINQFEALFWSGQLLDQLYEAAKRKVDNPLAAIFVSAMTECKRTDHKNNNDSFLKISHKDRIMQGMNLIKDREIEKLEKNLGFLAIVGSNALFVGLFGTVWGIMHSFQSIAASKNTTLAVVAPGIAEALLATAIGLVAAIPCVIFYTHLNAKVNLIYNKMDDFIGELYSLLSRAIDEGKI